MAYNTVDHDECAKERMRREIIGQPPCTFCDDGMEDIGMGQDGFWQDCTHCEGTGYQRHECVEQGVCPCIVLQALPI